MQYFVSFCYVGNGRLECGNCNAIADAEISSYQDVIKLQSNLEKKFHLENVIVLNYIPLGTTGSAYIRCGDHELFETDKCVIFKPNININFSVDESNLPMDEIVDKIRKSLAESLKRKE